MLEAMQGSYQFLLIIIVTFYAGERDLARARRQARRGDRRDAGAELGAAAREARRAARGRARCSWSSAC